MLSFPFGSECIPVITESNRPCNGELACRILNMFPDCICVIAPSILEEIAAGPSEGIQSVAAAHRVLFAGAPLSEGVGLRLIHSGVKLISF